jgi:hypothetical protein
MKQINSILLLITIFICSKSFAQCNVTISGDTCVNNILSANYTGDSLTKLTWLADNSIVYTSMPTGFNPAWSTGPSVNYGNGIFTDNKNNIYIAETGNQKILKYSVASGVTTTLLNLNYNPSDLCVFNDTIYVAGYYTASTGSPFMIKKYAPGDTTGILLAGDGTPNSIYETRTICVDKTGSIFYPSNGRILKLRIGTTVAVSVVPANSQFEYYMDLQIDDANYLYILDYYLGNLFKWKPGSPSGTIVAGGHGSGEADNQLMTPNQFYLDKKGNVYITETDIMRVTKWQLGASSGLTVAGGKVYNSSGPETNLYSPYGITFDTSGNMYVTNLTSLKKFNISNAVFTKYVTETGGNYKAISVSKNNCIDTSNTIFIRATPPPVPTSINGPSIVNANQTGIVFTVVPNFPGITYNWSLPKRAGSIVSGQGSSSITVNWHSKSGKLAVNAKNSCGFVSNGFIKRVKVDTTSTLLIKSNDDIKLRNESSMSLSPNPANDIVKVSYKAGSSLTYQLIISDINGKSIIARSGITSFGENVLTIDISKLAKGIYILRLSDGSNNVKVQKLIKE